MEFKIGDRVKCCCDMTRIDCQILDDYVIRVKNISYATSIQFKPNVIWIEWITNIGDTKGVWVNPEYVEYDYQYIRQKKLNNLLR